MRTLIGLSWCLFLAMGAAPCVNQVSAEDHVRQNSLFHDLLEKGATISANRREPLPKPTMADGLDAAAQAKILEGLASDGGISVDEFTRDSAVARFVQRLDEVKPPIADGTVRQLDAWFVAYGPFEKLSDKSFLDRVGAANGKDGASKPIDLAELAKRGIHFSAEESKSIGYGHVTANLMNQVELRMTGKSQHSRNNDSVVVASFIDDQFVNDPKFPNQWRHVGSDADKPVAYHGGGYYLKITRLKNPEGALFVESHSLFVEPSGWFGGANTLRSKMPAVVESQVRSFRRELQR